MICANHFLSLLLKSFCSLFILLMLACQPEKLKDFDHNGISFNLPKDWKISEVDSLDADYCSISLDPKAADGTSFIFIEWGKGLVDLDKQIKHIQSGYLEHPDLAQAGIEFTEIAATEFAKQKAVRTGFTFSISGIEQEGTLFCFQFPKCDKTVSIVIQNAAVDKTAIEEALKELEKSLICQ